MIGTIDSHARSGSTRKSFGVRFAAGLLVSLVIAPLHTQAHLPYVTTVWHTEQGLPQNSVNAMLQDRQGYLWFGTFGGLARFDGERFTTFDSVNTPGFGDGRMILALYESRSGDLWIGTVHGGVIRLHDGTATTYTERDGLPARFISSIRGDAQGNVWINTSGGVARFSGTKLERYPTHLGKPVREFYLRERDGSIWFRSGEELIRFGADGSIATVNHRKPSVFLVRESRDGSVWIGIRDEYRLVRYCQGAFSDVPLPPLGPRKSILNDDPQFVLTMAEDSNGELLLLTPAGLIRTVDGKLTPPEALPLPSNGRSLPKVRSLLVDREGNLWCGTVGAGLVRIRRSPLVAYTKDNGLSDSDFNAVFQDREGRIWLGGDSLYWFDGHQFHIIPRVVNIRAISQTHDGDLWFGGYGGLYRYRSGTLSFFKVAAPAVGAIHQDREGTLWIGAISEERPGGLYRFQGGKLDPIPGISGVDRIIEDRDGGLWVGGVEGIFIVRGGQTVRYDQRQGLPDHIVDMHQDSNGTLWAASYGGGLACLRNGRFKTISTKDGLPNNMLHGIVEDGRGNLWVSSNHDIFRLSLKELNDFADGRISSILPVSYGIAEGMITSECEGGNPGALKSNDGRIWFPTVRGVVAIDPTAGNRLPPPVVVEEAWANKLALARNGQSAVPPGNNTFDFRFTALSFSAPQEVRFKYRLEPYDKNWVDAGTQHTAHYTNMAPGEYSFHVVAANNYGIWNDQGARVRFVLQPHFYQTNWFYALCAVFFPALGWAVYQLRVRHLHREFKKLRDVIETIPAMAWITLPDGSTPFVNRRWAEYTGLSAEDLAGSGWTAVVHPEDRQPYWDKWRASLASGEPFECEARFRCAVTGEYRWFLRRAAPLRDANGKVVRWYGILTDIEDRKRAEQERQQLRQLESDLAHINRVSMMGELSASIAHEVNQPLTGIVSNGSACLRWMAADPPNLDRARESVRRIVRDGQRAGEVIARIRALTKRAATATETLDLNETIQYVLALVRDEARKHDIMIRTHFADDVLPVRGDRVQLQQVALNLVMNSIEAMSNVDQRARELVITTSNVGSDQAQVTVEDSGVGLDPNTMAKIFEPFYTTKPAGMGMGLSISRSILEAHGGRLWANARDGAGTMFHFTLPRSHEEPSYAAHKT